MLETLLRIESGILRAESPKAAADVALINLQRLIPCQASTVILFDADYTKGVVLSAINTVSAPGSVVPASAREVRARMRGEPLVIGDLGALPARSEAIQRVVEIGGRSLLSVPLLARGELLGTMSLIDEAPNAFAEEDVNLVQQIGNSVAIALYNARLLEKERETRQEADVLRDVAAIISASLGQENLLDLILSQLARVLAYDRALILRYEGNRLIVGAFRGRAMQLTEVPLGSPDTPVQISRLIEEKRPQLVMDSAKDPEWKILPGAEFVRCWIGVPMVMKDELMGLLMLDKEEPNSYSQRDVSVAIAFANHAVIALKNAQLYEEIRQYATALETQVTDRTRDLAVLYAISAIGGKHLELQETLDQIIAVIIETLGCSAASIHVLNESRSTLNLQAHRGLAPSMLIYMRELPASHPEMKEVLENSDTIVYSTGSLDQELADVPLPESFSFGVSTAIRAKEENLGVLGVGYDRQQSPTREDVALITSIADHIGVAIENARLRKKSEQLAVLNERERLAKELHDSATQSLFTMTLFAGAAREHLAAAEYQAVEEQLVELEATAVQTHKEMRLLLYELRPDILAEEGLEEALRHRLQIVESRSGIRGEVRADIPDATPFAVQETLFLVANEALNNTLRHSDANQVWIHIQVVDGHVEMQISDNGRGFSPISDKFTMGMGMNIMRQRLAEMNGTLRYESQLHEGTRVIALVPLEPDDGES